MYMMKKCGGGEMGNGKERQRDLKKKENRWKLKKYKITHKVKERIENYVKG